MNWFDWVLVAFFAFAAYKGFSRGFIVELGSLVALVAGIWAGIHLSDNMVDAIGLKTESAALAFLVTFVIVLLGVHLLARGLTALIDIAQLSLPNKLAGVVFGIMRSAFSWSILLNIVAGYSGDTAFVDRMEASSLYTPVRSFAPLVLPVLKESKWVQRTVDDVRNEVERVVGD